MYAVQDEPMAPVPYRVERIKRETQDTYTVELVPQGRRAPFPFAPGQFNMLYLYGTGESAISISGKPSDNAGLIHTVRAVGKVSEAITRLKHGQVVGVRGPFGTSWPVAEADGRDVVIVTGGIGLAPLRPLIYHVLEHRARFGKVALLYGARTPADILYRKELEQWRSRFDVQVRVSVDQGTGNWHGAVGLVTTLIPRAMFDPRETLACVCGPEIMMKYVIEELQKCEVAKDRIYVSMERHMKCAIGFCGYCQFGPKFVCKDGPVFRYDTIERLFKTREI